MPKTRSPFQVQVVLPTRSQVGAAARFAAIVAVTAASAIVTKELRSRSGLSPLAQVETTREVGAATPQAEVVEAGRADADRAEEARQPGGLGPSLTAGLLSTILPTGEAAREAEAPAWANDPTVRYFNGRPVRPARTIRMLVTAYSPDWRSCDNSDDGITASVHSVETNDGCLVAADTRVLPLGSMISVPGYDQGRVVPVLDRGGAIKGRRLDVLFSSHRRAVQWGSQHLDVIVWEYADGKPADNYREQRGARRVWR